jgi:hypothetical protein
VTSGTPRADEAVKRSLLTSAWARIHRVPGCVTGPACCEDQRVVEYVRREVYSTTAMCTTESHVFFLHLHREYYFSMNLGPQVVTDWSDGGLEYV